MIEVILFHVIGIGGIFVVGVSWPAVLAAVVPGYLGVLVVYVGYHRYLAHRAFKTSRWFQFVLAFSGCANLIYPARAWVEIHRRHHRDSDTDADIHSPKDKGFWYGQLFWMKDFDYFALTYENTRDMQPYPELLFISKYFFIPPLVYGLFMAGVGYVGAGSFGLEPHIAVGQFIIWGFFVRWMITAHLVFLAVSAVHMPWLGTRPYDTGDNSGNSLLVALLTGGEGWHNNHHR